MRTLALAVLFGALRGYAQTVYSWEDDAGVHYTDDVRSLPKSDATVAAIELESGPIASLGSSPPYVPPDPTPFGPPSERERQWRTRFVEHHQRIQSQDELLRRLRASLPAPTVCFQRSVRVGHQALGVAAGQPLERCRPNAEFTQMQAFIAVEETKLSDAKRQLEQLDRDASADNVPREWRRGF